MYCWKRQPSLENGFHFIEKRNNYYVDSQNVAFSISLVKHSKIKTDVLHVMQTGILFNKETMEKIVSSVDCNLFEREQRIYGGCRIAWWGDCIGYPLLLLGYINLHPP